ncbi:MAG: leucine-rich repeat domain-containing protein, partial [Merismopedia sp. SIO2A8]|nr:leucine-rich repeat domain-containing protein [Merismopedia sp. SIO2A8]
MASLPNLTELILYKNDVRDLSPLASLTNLTELHLE